MDSIIITYLGDTHKPILIRDVYYDEDVERYYNSQITINWVNGIAYYSFTELLLNETDEIDQYQFNSETQLTRIDYNDEYFRELKWESGNNTQITSNRLIDKQTIKTFQRFPFFERINNKMKSKTLDNFKEASNEVTRTFDNKNNPFEANYFWQILLGADSEHLLVPSKNNPISIVASAFSFEIEYTYNDYDYPSTLTIDNSNDGITDIVTVNFIYSGCE